MAAVVNTVITRRIDPECFDRFFNAMAMDLTTTSYQTWEDLRDYMEGSAAVIGEMMLPVLEPISQAAKAPARSLGLAFQLTNFLRDVDEDLDRGRVYMPQDDLRLFDVDLERRAVTPQWRAFLAYEIERNRALYSFADTGIAMLPPRSARCVGTARVLYAQILDQIERNGYDVFSERARVPTSRKAATAARMMVTGPRTLKRQAEAYQRRSMTMSLRTRTSPLPEVCETECPLADPDRTHSAAAGEPDGLDLAAGQAGSYCCGAANSPVAQLRRLVRRRCQRRRRAEGVGDAHHRRPRGGLLAQLRQADWSPGQARARTSGRCWTSAQSWTAPCIADGTGSR